MTCKCKRGQQFDLFLGEQPYEVVSIETRLHGNSSWVTLRSLSEKRNELRVSTRRLTEMIAGCKSLKERHQPCK